MNRKQDVKERKKKKKDAIILQKVTNFGQKVLSQEEHILFPCWSQPLGLTGKLQ